MSKRIALIVSLIFFSSCTVSRYLTGGQRIVNKNIIICDDKSINISKLKKNAQPQGIKKFLGIVPLRAMIYNLVDPRKDKLREQKRLEIIKKYNEKQDRKFEKKFGRVRRKYNIYTNKYARLIRQNDTIAAQKAYKKMLKYEQKLNYLTDNAADIKASSYKTNVTLFSDVIRSLGQKPPIVDTGLIRNTIQQFKNYFDNNGYLKAEITYKFEKLPRKRVNIIYQIKAGEPLKIGSVTYDFSPNPELVEIFDKHPEIKLKVGTKINFEELENFRLNFSEYARREGYYYFTKQLISYKLDTTKNRYSNANLKVEFERVDDPKIYSKWFIKNVYIFNDYSTQFEDSAFFDKAIDTQIVYNTKNQKYYYLSINRKIVKPHYLLSNIFIYPDSIYNLQLTRQTYQGLSKFQIYKFINIHFQENSAYNNERKYLDSYIYLIPQENTNLQLETSVSRNNVNIGVNANIVFSHRNLFKGGEVFEWSNFFALENYKTIQEQKGFFNAQQFSWNISLIFPRFLAFWKPNDFILRNNPRTSFSLMFDYENNPDYKRLQTSFYYNFILKTSEYSIFNVSLVNFSLLKATLSEDFKDFVERAFLNESYSNQTILGSKFSYTFNKIRPSKSTYFNVGTSLAGNTLWLLKKVFKADTIDYYYTFPFTNEAFAQFFKINVEYRNIFKDNQEQLAYRLYLGIGVPYGNSHYLPFSERFSIGGANSIRAWQARTLGPGEYKAPEIYKYAIQTADIRLEANIEYRFRIISLLEGAVFVDAGNIWNINSYDSRTGGIFYFDKFINQIAVGTGTGLRINANFFILRLDFGLKLVDPSLPAGQRFIPFNRPYNWSDIVSNLAFGYPF